MSTNLKLLDTFKLSGHLNTNFACGLSQDNRIFIISDIGLYIITQKPNLDSIFSEYMCQKYFLKPTNFAVCDNVDIDINSFIYELPKDILYESTMCLELTQNLKGAAPSSPSILSARWSDSSMVDGLGSMLGLLTNLYSLEIYIKSVSENNITEYKMITNITKIIIDQSKGDFVYSNKMPPSLKIRELKKRVEYIAPTTFEWGHTFPCEDGNCTVIFIGHFYGEISFWKLFSVESCAKDTRCDFLGRYKSKVGNISALCWHRTAEYGGALCVGDSNGKISVLQISDLEKQECSVLNEVEFYSDHDRKVDKITVMTFKNFTILIGIKHCYLLVYALDLSGHVFDFTVHNVHNFYITGITHKDNLIKVLTFTGVFKELQISVHFNKIVIEETSIPVKFDFSAYRTHGFVESSNKVLFAFILSPYRFKNSVRHKKFVNFCLFNDVNLNPLKLLLENQSGSLRTFWDCFEALRLVCLKEQRFPWLGLSSNLELDNLSLIQLKTLRLVSMMSETVFAVIKRVISYEIKPYVLLHYLVDIKLITQRLGKLFKDKCAGKVLSLFELRSIDLQVFFLKEMVVSGIIPKAQVGATFIKEISHILAMANELKYPDMIDCNFCGEKLIGSTCLPPHADSRCVFTMMPIFLSTAYKCVLCNSVAHIELKKEFGSICCPYCDYSMERICLSKNLEENMDNFKLNEGQVKSRCFSDCLWDSEEVLEDLYLNLEENEITVISVSDDESEEENRQNELKRLYFKFTDLELNDSVNESTNVMVNVKNSSNIGDNK